MAETSTTQRENLAFQLKGSLFTLTVFSLYSLDEEMISAQLSALIESSPKFFQHTPLVLDLTTLATSFASPAVAEQTLRQLLATLKQHKLMPIGIRGANEALQPVALSLGLALLGNKVDKTESSYGYRVKKSQEKYQQYSNTELAPSPTDAKDEDTTKSCSDPATPTDEKTTPPLSTPGSLVITNPVRSGQQIYARGGDLIILASVSHGAEVLADGNIHIYGTLNGRALAGVKGNEQAHLFCQRLDAELIAIAGHYKVREDILLPEGEGSIIDVYYEADQLKIRRL